MTPLCSSLRVALLNSVVSLFFHATLLGAHRHFAITGTRSWGCSVVYCETIFHLKEISSWSFWLLFWHVRFLACWLAKFCYICQRRLVSGAPNELILTNPHCQLAVSGASSNSNILYCRRSMDKVRSSIAASHCPNPQFNCFRYIVLNRNGSANLLEAASRSFDPLVLFNEMKCVCPPAEQ